MLGNNTFFCSPGNFKILYFEFEFENSLSNSQILSISNQRNFILPHSVEFTIMVLLSFRKTKYLPSKFKTMES